MVSLIMMADSIARARSREVNRQMLNHIAPIALWMLIVMITLVFIYVCYRVNSDRKAKESEVRI